jgi:hypothetical protein
MPVCWSSAGASKRQLGSGQKDKNQNASLFSGNNSKHNIAILQAKSKAIIVISMTSAKNSNSATLKGSDG